MTEVVDKGIIEYLNKRSEELLLFKTNPNVDLIEQAKNLQVSELESIADVTLSKYVMVLSQYLIYLTSQTNKSRVMYKIYSRKFEKKMNRVLEDVKGKTLAERKLRAIDGDVELQQLEYSIMTFEFEVEMCKDIDKQITLLINALKREMTRREQEKNFIRYERRGR